MAHGADEIKALVASINANLQWCTNKSLKFDKDSVQRNYLNEIWLSEIPPPTQALMSYVVNSDKDEFIDQLKLVAPTLSSTELDSWWTQMSNLCKATKTLFSAEYDCVK